MELSLMELSQTVSALELKTWPLYIILWLQFHQRRIEYPLLLWISPHIVQAGTYPKPRRHCKPFIPELRNSGKPTNCLVCSESILLPLCSLFGFCAFCYIIVISTVLTKVLWERDEYDQIWDKEVKAENRHDYLIQKISVRVYI